MPGFTTHYLFGLHAYRKFAPSPLKQTIQKHHAAYSLGLQGPDLFFYFLPSYIIHKNNIGSVAHTEKINTFLRHLLDSRKLFAGQKERKAAEAYIAGFLGHYALDAHCHPYVYWKTKFKEKNSRYHGRHIGLETEIDRELLRRSKHIPPSCFCQDSTLRLSRLQKQVVARILHYVYSKTYPELTMSPAIAHASITSIQMGAKFVHDPSGRKKAVVGALEKLLLGHPLLSTLIPSNAITVHTDPLNLRHRRWENPWDKSLTSTDSFLGRMGQAQGEYLKTLSSLDALFRLRPHTAGEAAAAAKLLAKLGNSSYHSGMDAAIPS